MKEDIKREEESYGHELDSEDILGMWKEKISKHFVDLLALKKHADLTKKQELAVDFLMETQVFLAGKYFLIWKSKASLRNCLDFCMKNQIVFFAKKLDF